MSVYEVRAYAALPGILKAAARAAWRDAKHHDGYVYKTLEGSLIERMPAPQIPDEEYVWNVIDPAGLLH